MVQDHWFVGFRSQFVTCTAYAWSQRDGYHTRGLRRHPEGAFSYSGRIVGAAAELGPLGGGAGADARVGGRTCCAKYRAPDVTPPERVRQAQLDSLAGASRAPLYDAFILFSLPRGCIATAKSSYL